MSKSTHTDSTILALLVVGACAAAAESYLDGGADSFQLSDPSMNITVEVTRAECTADGDTEVCEYLATTTGGANDGDVVSIRLAYDADGLVRWTGLIEGDWTDSAADVYGEDYDFPLVQSGASVGTSLDATDDLLGNDGYTSTLEATATTFTNRDGKTWGGCDVWKLNTVGGDEVTATLCSGVGLARLQLAGWGGDVQRVE